MHLSRRHPHHRHARLVEAHKHVRQQERPLGEAGARHVHETAARTRPLGWRHLDHARVGLVLEQHLVVAEVLLVERRLHSEKPRLRARRHRALEQHAAQHPSNHQRLTTHTHEGRHRRHEAAAKHAHQRAAAQLARLRLDARHAHRHLVVERHRRHVHRVVVDQVHRREARGRRGGGKAPHGLLALVARGHHVGPHELAEQTARAGRVEVGAAHHHQCAALHRAVQRLDAVRHHVLVLERDHVARVLLVVQRDLQPHWACRMLARDAFDLGLACPRGDHLGHVEPAVQIPEHRRPLHEAFAEHANKRATAPWPLAWLQRHDACTLHHLEVDAVVEVVLTVGADTQHVVSHLHGWRDAHYLMAGKEVSRHGCRAEHAPGRRDVHEIVPPDDDLRGTEPAANQRVHAADHRTVLVLEGDGLGVPRTIIHHLHRHEPRLSAAGRGAGEPVLCVEEGGHTRNRLSEDAPQARVQHARLAGRVHVRAIDGDRRVATHGTTQRVDLEERDGLVLKLQRRDGELVRVHAHLDHHVGRGVLGRDAREDGRREHRRLDDGAVEAAPRHAVVGRELVEVLPDDLEVRPAHHGALVGPQRMHRRLGVVPVRDVASGGVHVDRHLHRAGRRDCRWNAHEARARHQAWQRRD